jgi:hypothetical protein
VLAVTSCDVHVAQDDSFDRRVRLVSEDPAMVHSVRPVPGATMSDREAMVFGQCPELVSTRFG